jgi:hypothetical protein
MEGDAKRISTAVYHGGDKGDFLEKTFQRGRVPSTADRSEKSQDNTQGTVQRDCEKIIIDKYMVSCPW